MKKLLGALLALIVVLVLFVVIVAATLPAATAYRYAEPRVQPLRLQGIDGSLWAGRATQASVYAVPLGELRWSLDPWAAVGLHARGEAALSGRANTALNLLAFAGAFGLQWGFGVLVDLLQAGDWSAAAAYRAAFLTLLAGQGMAFTWLVASRKQA